MFKNETTGTKRDTAEGVRAVGGIGAVRRQEVLCRYRVRPTEPAKETPARLLQATGTGGRLATGETACRTTPMRRRLLLRARGLVRQRGRNGNTAGRRRPTIAAPATPL
jgi:hypothetical protein